MTTHEITINPDRCHGTHICPACEVILPGLVKHCEEHGRLLLGEWALREKSPVISRLLVACPSRAIMVRPVELSRIP